MRTHVSNPPFLSGSTKIDVMSIREEWKGIEESVTLVTSEGREETNGLDEGEEEGGERLSPMGRKGRRRGTKNIVVLASPHFDYSKEIDAVRSSSQTFFCENKDFLYCVRAQFLRLFFARTVSPLYFVHENLLGMAPQPPRQ